ncbi:uncharacterized protein LOC115219941 [Argonauta hians]
MKKTMRVFLYFMLWILFGLGCAALNILNIDWEKTSIPQGAIFVIVLGILQGSVCEFPVQTIATLIVGGKKRQNRMADGDNFTLILNYNLLAVTVDDIEECFQTMFQAFMGNLSFNVSAVLVSATSDEKLKVHEIKCRDRYRRLIYDELFKEGVCFANGFYNDIQRDRFKNVWMYYHFCPRDIFINHHLDSICDRFAQEFMVIHRTSKVLRKCGQYQDLMLLSEGESFAYTYTDKKYYGRLARPYNQPTFYFSEDVQNIFNRRFDYTLVLDADTGVPDGTVERLLGIAAANPEKGIIQPSIKLSYEHNDTMYMRLEAIKQMIYEPMTNAITALLGQCGFFGKGLIKNRIYIDNVIGSRENLIERVPIDVLSHDTFEAALLKPYYAGSVFLLEAPSFNYITWNIRERRWNRGEVILSMYFWKNTIGVLMRTLQRIFQRDKFNKTTLRTESKLDFVTAYIAHSALRQMLMKPFLLVFICLHIGIELRYPHAPIFVIMFLVIVFPKFATCTKSSFKYIILETFISVIQFTPEAIVGCVRIFRAIQANISANCKWVPQRSVEEEFKKGNPFLFSLKHLWVYSFLGAASTPVVLIFSPSSSLILCMLITLFLLPLFTGVTSLTTGLKSSQSLVSTPKQPTEVSIIETSSTLTLGSKSALSYSIGGYLNRAYVNNW